MREPAKPGAQTLQAAIEVLLVNTVEKPAGHGTHTELEDAYSPTGHEFPDTVALAVELPEGTDDPVDEAVDEPVPVADGVGDQERLADAEADGDKTGEGDGTDEGDDAALCVPDAVAEGVDVAVDVDETVAVTEPDKVRLGVGVGELDADTLDVDDVEVEGFCSVPHVRTTSPLAGAAA